MARIKQIPVVRIVANVGGMLALVLLGGLVAREVGATKIDWWTLVSIGLAVGVASAMADLARNRSTA